MKILILTIFVLLVISCKAPHGKPQTYSVCTKMEFFNTYTHRLDTGYSTLQVRSDTVLMFDIPDHDDINDSNAYKFYGHEDFYKPVVLNGDDNYDIIIKTGLQYKFKVIWDGDDCESEEKMDSIENSSSNN